MAARKSFTHVFFLAYLCLASTNKFIARKHSSFGHTYKTLPVRSRIECCSLCTLQDDCVSVNFVTTDRKCELNSKNPADFPYTNISASTNKQLYYMDTAPCAVSWKLFDRHCYHVQGTPMTWQESQDNCTAMGANMTDVTDNYQNTFIANTKGNYKVWIGMENVHSAMPLWTNGKPVQYVNFGSKEPDNRGGIENCVGMVGHGQWADYRCYVLLPGGGVCKKRHY